LHAQMTLACATHIWMSLASKRVKARLFYSPFNRDALVVIKHLQKVWLMRRNWGP